MSDKHNKRSLAREGEPSQKTKEGLEIPVPKTDDFFGLLKKATRKAVPGEKSSQPDRDKP